MNLCIFKYIQESLFPFLLEYIWRLCTQNPSKWLHCPESFQRHLNILLQSTMCWGLCIYLYVILRKAPLNSFESLSHSSQPCKNSVAFFCYVFHDHPWLWTFWKLVYCLVVCSLYKHFTTYFLSYTLWAGQFWWLLFPSISATHLFSFSRKDSDFIKSCEFTEAYLSIISSRQCWGTFLRFHKQKWLHDSGNISQNSSL